MDSDWWLFLVCAVVLCTVMAGATDAPLEQGRISLFVCLSVCQYIYSHKLELLQAKS